MLKGKMVQKTVRAAALIAVAMLVLAPMALAQDHGEGASASGGLGEGLKIAGVAIGAGLAVLGGALGTGRAQGAIGAGGTGAIAEKPELFGRVFILVALPETVVVLAFVLGFMILGLAG